MFYVSGLRNVLNRLLGQINLRVQNQSEVSPVCIIHHWMILREVCVHVLQRRRVPLFAIDRKIIECKFNTTGLSREMRVKLLSVISRITRVNVC